MKPSKVRRRLKGALRSKRAVRLWRDKYDTAYIDGLVIALPGKWVVVNVISDGVYLDGVVMMRLRDINKVLDAHSDYLERALCGLGQDVASFEGPADPATRDLVAFAVDQHPLSAFCLGDEDREQLMIGVLIKAGRKYLQHRFIRLNGTWGDEIDRWRYGQISSIHIGGRYIDALARFGAPPPEVGPSSDDQTV